MTDLLQAALDPRSIAIIGASDNPNKIGGRPILYMKRHGFKGLGATYTILPERPTAENLVKLLAYGRLVTNRPPLRTLLYPKAHRLRKKITRMHQ